MLFNVLVLYYILISFVPAISSSGSFYGGSFSFKRLNDFSSKSTASIQFQTKLPNGVLLLAMGENDYFMIYLKNGKLEVNISAKYGEGVVKSQNDVLYNDQLWHQVDVLKLGSLVDIRVDGEDVASNSLWISSENNLNINLGVFLGGYDDHIVSAQLDLTLPFFRGCIFNAKYNGIDVLHPLHNKPNERLVHNVDAGCSRVFRAHQTDPLGFTSPHGYLKYERWTSRSDGTFECQIKTLYSRGLLLFNNGWRRNAFVGLEIIGGAIRGSLNDGSGVVSLQSTQLVNDGKWHRIRFSFSPTILDIRVDKNRTKVFIEHERENNREYFNNEPKLKGPLYVGGIEEKDTYLELFHANGLPLDAFPGCLRNIRVDYRTKYIHDILSSHKLSIGCKLNQFDWSNFNPTYPSLPTFVIIPQTPSPAPNHIQLQNALKHAVQVDEEADKICFIINQNNFTVEEDDSVLLAPNIFEIAPSNLLDSAKFFPQFNISLAQLPPNGLLLLHEQPLAVGSKFLWNTTGENRLTYHHDGTITLNDTFTLTVRSANVEKAINETVTFHLCNKSDHIIEESNATFFVNITSFDDIPVLDIPTDYVFRVIAHSRTPFPEDMFQAVDDDSPLGDIFYHLVGIGTGLFVENVLTPGRPISLFTQEDIDLGRVNFVHVGGSRNSRLLFQVSNLKDEYNVAYSSLVLRISAIDLQISVSNNSGITLVEGESFVLTSNQLTSQTNAGNSIVDVLYTIKQAPRLGQVEVLLGDEFSEEAWVSSSSFFQSQLSDGRVRYTSLGLELGKANAMQDSFFFTVSGCEISTRTISFNITILKVKISVVTNQILLENGSLYSDLKNNFITVDYTGLQRVQQSEIHFLILKQFSSAQLTYRDEYQHSVSDVFSMVDVADERLRVRISPKYVIKQLAELHDAMIFKVVIRGRYQSSNASLNLTFIPDLKVIKVISSPLFVDEGHEVRITEKNLFARTLLHHRFTFNVVTNPRFGTIVVQGQGSSTEKRTNVTSFTSVDILNGNVYYRHDDSENDQDLITFQILPLLRGELPETVMRLANTSAYANLNVSVHLLNDNPPLRVVSKPFKVVRYGERLMTRSDIWYDDPDINQDVLDLKYVRRGITNGDILNATTMKKIFEFTQYNIASGQVLFRHRKADFGRFVFWVRDGKNFATDLFIVEASDPYLNIVNSTWLSVEKNGYVNISRSNIQADTNIVGLRSSIKYKLARGPNHGQVLLNNSPVSTFTQQEIDDGLLSYHHGTSPYMRDDFTYTVTAKDTSLNETLQIQMFLASLQKPPTVRRNRLIVLDQSSAVTIGRSDLHAVHQDVRPRDIRFNIRKAPSFGNFLLNRMSPNLELVHSPEVIFNVTEFSQSDINLGFLSYNQSTNVTFDFNILFDNYTFDVSNGILSLNDVKGQIQIVPKDIPLRVSDFKVEEGRSRILISEYLDVPNRHFSNFDIDIYVIKQPSNGMLTREPGKRLNEFSLRLVQAELVSYTHDGSDTLKDAYQLQARSSDGSRTSKVVTTHVIILPDNDQAPSVVNNTGLKVWINSITSIYPVNLATVDLDSPPKNLTYNILPPQNGHVALRGLPKKSISNFTQEDINFEKVVFVHKGSNTGGFTFQVNDGRNFDTKQIFVITARLLVIDVKNNDAIQIFPSTLSLISSNDILAKTNDHEPRDVSFYLSKVPRFGVLMKKLLSVPFNFSQGVPAYTYAKVEEFTQSDINSSLIYYNQTIEMTSWNTIDKMGFTVSSFPAEDKSDIWLSLNVSYDNYKLEMKSSPLKINKGETILEGGSFNLSISNLDASNLFNKLSEQQRDRYSLKYRVVTKPLHGHLYVGSRLLLPNDSFLHTFVEQRIVNYTNDDSENVEDFFTFEAYLQHKAQSSNIYPFRVRDKFNITILAVDDNPPVLESRTPQLETVQGADARINSSFLKSIDVDTSSSKIIYRILRAPTYGRLVSTLTDKRVTSFTQKDIDQNLILYKQNKPGGASQYPSGNTSLVDAFYFSLTDSLHRPSYSLFSIKILPVIIRCSTKTLIVKQGDISTFISTRNLDVVTNGDPMLLCFHPFVPPFAGNLFINDEEVNFFTFDDLLQYHVTYLMRDMEQDEDQIRFLITYNSSHANNYQNETCTLDIVVDPRIELNHNFSVLTNTTVTLTLKELNASELAYFSSSTPIYQVEKSGKFAHLLVIGKGDENPESLIRFSHDDLISGEVQLKTGTLNTNDSCVKDQFVIRLTVVDGSVQPVSFIFSFQIFVSNKSEEVQQLVARSITGANVFTVPDMTTADVFNTSSSSQTKQTLSTSKVKLNRDFTASVDVTTLDKSIKEVKNESISPFVWIIPLIFAIIVILIIAIIIVCICRCRNKGPEYIKGQKSPTLKATSPTNTVPLSDQNKIDSDTFVKVTSSRTDTREVSQQCPTASVIVTALASSSRYDDSDDGYAGDGYISNSMPPEGHLAAFGLHTLAVNRENISVSSPQGLGDPEASASTNYCSVLPLPLKRDIEEFSSFESIDSFNDKINSPRNNSSASLPMGTNQLTAPALDLNQYWF